MLCNIWLGAGGAEAVSIEGCARYVFIDVCSCVRKHVVLSLRLIYKRHAMLMLISVVVILVQLAYQPPPAVTAKLATRSISLGFFLPTSLSTLMYDVKMSFCCSTPVISDQ
jgi:hypothetical protein